MTRGTIIQSKPWGKGERHPQEEQDELSNDKDQNTQRIAGNHRQDILRIQFVSIAVARVKPIRGPNGTKATVYATVLVSHVFCLFALAKRKKS